MNKEKCIEELEDLRCYIEEEWDMTDAKIKSEIEIKCKAIDYALSLIKNGNVVGFAEINGNKYCISE